VSAASPSRVVSNPPVSDVLTSTVINTSVGPLGNDDLRILRREAILIDSSRVPQRPLLKNKGKSTRASRSASANNTSRSTAVESSNANSLPVAGANNWSSTAPSMGTSSRGRASLVRHNIVLETDEFGRRAADASNCSKVAYRVVRSACLLYLEDNQGPRVHYVCLIAPTPSHT